MSNYIPVEGHPNLVKDPVSGAILNTDNKALEAYRIQRTTKILEQQRLSKLEREFNEVKSSINEMKDLLTALVQRDGK